MGQQQFPGFRSKRQFRSLGGCTVMILIRHLRQIMGKGCFVDDQISSLRQRQTSGTGSGVSQNGDDPSFFRLEYRFGCTDHRSVLHHHILALLQLAVQRTRTETVAQQQLCIQAARTILLCDPVTIAVDPVFKQTCLYFKAVIFKN
ncbi:hypothetical protein D3C73_1265350 [compost metagenome]